MKDQEPLILLCDLGKHCWSDRGRQRRHIQLPADQAVKLSDSSDGGGFFIPNCDGEEFFCTKNNLYGVKSQRSRLARKIEHCFCIVANPELLASFKV
jgi:hypothetical protein